MANEGHYRREGGTRQGIYVCTPGGELLASINSTNPERVLETLREGWRRWLELDPGSRHLADAAELTPIGRWEEQFPEGGLILSSTIRELSEDEDVDVRSLRWNRDRAWFTPAEARRWLPEDPQVGERYTLDRDLALRFARFHLVDNARGQTVPFAESEIETLEFDVEVRGRAGDRVELSFRGRTRAHAPGPWQMEVNDFMPKNGREYVHGLESRFAGTAAFDLSASRFVSFELLARCTRWGRTENNGRGSQQEPSEIGILFYLAPPGAAERMPPAFLEVYGADWVRTRAEPLGDGQAPRTPSVSRS